MKPSEDWLRAINEKFRREDVPPKARPILLYMRGQIPTNNISIVKILRLVKS
jgi:hypothetical protein